ncbi:LOW QUALITY PROTEIN: linker for activation of T-cells family member 1 [Pipistrellus kuhlii]|uniref:LOW QUALITY PROTEIN: linker for activation of T-cells family member 1 n=1 Tax=Pipistrellus kuhlii TaxID=59472 RepID=UPI001E270298|nr:LOW QUALITY PROTEIN: linker for activation of T-cells family member 1 [Pipistrellus kuhlii]
MEAAILLPPVLGLLLLPLLAVLLLALCVRCRELPDAYDSAVPDSLPSSIVIKRPPTLAPWPQAAVTSCPPLSQPDLLPIPRSPRPPGGSHRMPSARQDSDGTNSVASYENEGASGPRGRGRGQGGGGPGRARLTPCPPPEPACEDDDDDDEEDYHNEGYLEVLPDTVPATATATATCTAVPAAAAPSNPGLRDSAFSMESGEDYVNVPESEESADLSLDGSREYVNVSEDLQPTERTEAATLSSQEAEEEEEEGAPDYENLQELQ